MSDIDNNYIGIVLEDIRDQNTTILEAVGSMQDKIETLATKDALARLESRVDTIELVVTETNRDVIGLRDQVVRLESKVDDIQVVTTGTNKDVADLKQRVTKLEQTAK